MSATAVKTTKSKPSTFQSALTTVRRTRRAYIGAHVMAFEFARKRAELRLSQLSAMGEALVKQGEAVEDSALDVLDTAKDKVTARLPKLPKKTVTVDVKPTRVAKPSSKKVMTTIRTEKPKPAAKPQPKAKPEPKAAASDAKPAAQAGKILKDRYTPHVEAAKAYDADVNPVHIKAIVDHLGVALTTRDGKYVACSDAAERETVAKSWLLKKLGVEADAAALDAKVAAICEEMKAERMKSRVVFYYLLAKAEGKLGTL